MFNIPNQGNKNKNQNECYPILSRIAILEKAKESKWQCGCGEKGTLMHHRGGDVNSAFIMGNGKESPQKVKNRTTV